MNHEQLQQIGEAIANKPFNLCEPNTIRYYYNSIFTTPLKENCSSCLKDAHASIKQYYTLNMAKYNPEHRRQLQAKLATFRDKLTKLEQQEKYELAAFVMAKIKHYENILND